MRGGKSGEHGITEPIGEKTPSTALNSLNGWDFLLVDVGYLEKQRREYVRESREWAGLGWGTVLRL